MNSEAQSILYNLRLLGGLPDDQWMLTERIEGTLNFIGFCCNTVYNNFILSLKQDGWPATQECLKTLYCERLPVLVKILMEKKELSDLSHLKDQIDESLVGLKNIRKCYKDDPAACSHIDAFMHDFAETISAKIKKYLDENEDVSSDYLKK